MKVAMELLIAEKVVLQLEMVFYVKLGGVSFMRMSERRIYFVPEVMGSPLWKTSWGRIMAIPVSGMMQPNSSLASSSG